MLLRWGGLTFCLSWKFDKIYCLGLHHSEAAAVAIVQVRNEPLGMSWHTAAVRGQTPQHTGPQPIDRQGAANQFNIHMCKVRNDPPPILTCMFAMTTKRTRAHTHTHTYLLFGQGFQAAQPKQFETISSTFHELSESTLWGNRDASLKMDVLSAREWLFSLLSNKSRL